VNVATVSYDSEAVLRRFSDAHHISYPMLSDQGSEVIRRFGILNTNVPSDVRFYGIPFPGEYLLAPDGTVKSKLFLPDYEERPTAAAVLLKQYGTALGNAVTLQTGELKARVMLSNVRAFVGQQLGVSVDFDVAPGWHVYGQPLPEEYTPTAVTFDKQLLSEQKLDFPKPTPVKFELLGETLPVYQGRFRAIGDILLRQQLTPGEHQLGGTLSFQECNDNLCKMPQQVHFEIPLRIDALVPATAK
jgi:DsbC/DsbD-like thiol-disulfide interchange protein